MFRIEIKTIIVLPISSESSFYKRTHRHLLKREVERAALDPVSYQSEHECSVSVVGAIVDGPIAETRFEKPADKKCFARFVQALSLEPPGFPAV